MQIPPGMVSEQRPLDGRFSSVLWCITSFSCSLRVIFAGLIGVPRLAVPRPPPTTSATANGSHR